MKYRITLSASMAIGAGMLLGLVSPSNAIPAFARKYHTTCARCHSVVPRLNIYGWNFKLRGFHVPGDEELGKVPMPEDPMLHLLDQVPLAIRVLGSVQDKTGTHTKPNVVLDSKLELLMGGTLAHRMGFYLELEAEKQDTGDFSPAIGNARAMFTDLMRRDPIALN